MVIVLMVMLMMRPKHTCENNDATARQTDKPLPQVCCFFDGESIDSDVLLLLLLLLMVLVVIVIASALRLLLLRPSNKRASLRKALSPLLLLLLLLDVICSSSIDIDCADGMRMERWRMARQERQMRGVRGGLERARRGSTRAETGSRREAAAAAVAVC